MSLISNLKRFAIVVVFSIFFTGCVQEVNKEGVTLGISGNQLTDSFKDSFPFEKNFVFGDLALKKPSIQMPKESNRINASIELGLKTLFTNAIRGNFTISGEPKFNQKDSSIYLQNLQLESFDFGRLKISDEFANTFRGAVRPMVNEIFKNYPIYKIPKDSFQGKFVKNIKVENSKLLVTYGL